MKKLYIIRHAKAVPGDDDKARPLSEGGIKQMKRLRANESKIFKSLDLILCSPSIRTRETLEGFKACLREKVEIRYVDDLYSSSAEIILREIGAVEDKYDHVMIVGHNPEVTDFALNVCAHQDKSIAESMPKGSIAEYSFSKKSWHGVQYGDLKFIQLIYP